MLEDEIRLATLRERLEDRPNNQNVTLQLGEIPTKTLLRLSVDDQKIVATTDAVQQQHVPCVTKI